MNAPQPYPQSDLDKPESLLSLLGSFWNTTYQGSDLVTAMLAARAAAAQQNHDRWLDLLDSCSRLTIQPVRRVRWQPITLLASQRGAGLTQLKFGASDLLFDATYVFGQSIAAAAFIWPLDSTVTSVAAISSGPLDGNLLITGLDFQISNGYLLFQKDPFQTFAANVETIEGEQVLTIWACDVAVNESDAYKQYGFVLGLPPSRADKYVELINAMFDALRYGTTIGHLQRAMSAVTDIPLVRTATEIVEQIQRTDSQLTIVTDVSVYLFAPQATEIVAVGDTVTRGQPLVDAMQIVELNRGAVPDLSGLAMPKSTLLCGLTNSLVFENKSVPLQVTTDENGKTKLAFAVGGWPADAEAFFNELHRRGAAAGSTMANLLDCRPVAARTSEPTAGSLPATINPLQFICANVLREHAVIITLKPAAFGPGAVGADAINNLRLIIPPEKLVMFCAELDADADEITMDGYGDADRAGYNEELSAVDVEQLTAEKIDATVVVTENLRVTLIGTECAA